MGCSCKDRGKKTKFKVRLAGGLEVPKNSEDEAKAFSLKHPGSKVIKPAA